MGDRVAGPVSEKRTADQRNLDEALKLIRERIPGATSAVFETSDQQRYGFRLHGVLLADATNAVCNSTLCDEVWDLVGDIDWDGVMGEDEHGHAEVPIPKAVQMDDVSAAFFKGVAAGSRASEQIEGNEALASADFITRRSLYWFLVGREATELSTQPEVDNFIAGASTRQPTHSGVMVMFSTDTEAFHPTPDEDERWEMFVDRENRSAEIVRVLKDVADAVDTGTDQGPVRDSKGRMIGTFEITE